MRAISKEWEELKKCRQNYRKTIFDWCHLGDDEKHRDLVADLNGKKLKDRLLVADFLQSSEMWDRATVALVWSELVDSALTEQEEVAAWSLNALCKLKNLPLRFEIAHRVFEIAEKEEGKDNWQVFHNGWILLYSLGCKKELLDFIEKYSSEMEPDEFDEHDWADFNNMRDM